MIDAALPVVLEDVGSKTGVRLAWHPRRVSDFTSSKHISTVAGQSSARQPREQHGHNDTSRPATLQRPSAQLIALSDANALSTNNASATTITNKSARKPNDSERQQFACTLGLPT